MKAWIGLMVILAIIGGVGVAAGETGLVMLTNRAEVLPWEALLSYGELFLGVVGLGFACAGIVCREEIRELRSEAN